MKPTPTQQHLFAALFVTIAILALTPALAAGDQQVQTKTITLDLNGQATAIGNGLSGACTLKLTGDANVTSNQWLMIQNVTGSLQIGSTTIQITGGQGSVKNAGATAIFADTNSGKGQLILIGTMTNNNTVTFNSPESQLASTSYLTLSGTVNETNGNLVMNSGNTNTNSTSVTTVPQNSTQTNSTATSSTVKFQNTTSIQPVNMTTTNATVTSSTSLTTIPQNNTQTTNSTTTSSTVQLQNTTSIESGNMTSTAVVNVTSSMTLSNSTNSTVMASSNIPPSVIQTPSNVTVTVTRYLNQTISVTQTQTVANVTISYTVTSTVANTTITQGNVTTTVNATTTTGP